MSQTPSQSQPLTHEELFAHHDTGGSGLGAFTATLPEPAHDADTDLPEKFQSDTRVSRLIDGIRVESVVTINTVIQGTVREEIDNPEDEQVPADTPAYEAYTVDPVGDSIAGQLVIYRAGKYHFSDDWKYYTTDGHSADIAHVAIDNEITPAPDTDAERYERLKAVTGSLIHFDPDSPGSMTVGTVSDWDDGQITIAYADGSSTEHVEINCDPDTPAHSWFLPTGELILGGDNPVIQKTVTYETDDSDSVAADTDEQSETTPTQTPEPLGVTTQLLPEEQRDALNTIAALPTGKYLLGPTTDTEHSEIGLYAAISTGLSTATIPVQVLSTEICQTAFHSDTDCLSVWDDLSRPDLSSPSPDESAVSADASVTDLTGVGPKTAQHIRGETSVRSSHQTNKSPTEIAYVLDDDETYDSVDATVTVEKLAPDEQSEAFRQAQANYTPPEDETADTADTDDKSNSQTLAEVFHTHPDLMDVGTRFLPRAVADLRSAMDKTPVPAEEVIQRVFTYTTTAKLVDQDGAAISNLPQLVAAIDDWPSPPPAVARTWGASTASPLPLNDDQIALLSNTTPITEPTHPEDDSQLTETGGQSIDVVFDQSGSAGLTDNTETILVATPDSYCPKGTHLDDKTVDPRNHPIPGRKSIATVQVDSEILTYVGALFGISLTPEYLCEYARIDDGTLIISHESPYLNCWFAIASGTR